MTEIILLMWLADVIGSIGFMASLLCLLMFFVLAIGTFNGLATSDTAGIFKYSHRIRWWFITAMLVAVLVPNPITIRMLAVSKASELALSTSLGKKTVEALDVLLDEAIKRKK